MKTEIKQTANQIATAELVSKLKSFGYIIYLAEKGDYGFFHRQNEDKHISFQIDYFFFSFSSNYKSKGLGSGHQITRDEQCNIWDIDKFCTKEFCEALLNCNPYKSKRSGEVFLKWSTVAEHLEFYGQSSKYTVI